MIEIELVRPAAVGWAEAAFCAACAAYDDAFTDDRPVQAVVRVDGRAVRVRASFDDRSGWSGAVVEASAEERGEADRWRLFREVDIRFGWGGWDEGEFRWSERSPYDVAGLLPYLVVSLGDHHLAVIIDPITPEQRAGLDRAQLPVGIETLIMGLLITPPDATVARIDGQLVRPTGVDPATVAAALAAGCYLGGRLEVEPEKFVVGSPGRPAVGDHGVRDRRRPAAVVLPDASGLSRESDRGQGSATPVTVSSSARSLS